MALAPGTRLGSYEVTAQIGVGGMGEVYRAIDTNLKRAVAIKVLPAAVASDAGRLARFQREAEVLASLNHPNIAAIYGLERSDGTTALVMELVEGPTLGDRMARGPVPLDEALPIARQIAEALEAAHEKGIIHRDLKPANIALTANDQVKVLDFGLAKALEDGAPGESRGPGALANSPTMTSPAVTRMGMILGTAAYMSPEQAKGRAADRRSDVWAFGVVVYEMLTGQRAFEGEDVSDTLAAVLRGEPNWTALPASTPPSIRRLLRRCLEKDRTRRLDSAAAARLEIEDALNSPQTDEQAGQPVRLLRQPEQSGRRRALLALAAGLVAVGLVVAGWRMGQVRGAVPLGAPVNFDIVLPTGFHFGIGSNVDITPHSGQLSDDGRTITFVATAPDGRKGIWIRRLDSPSLQYVGGTEDAVSEPFWAPDGTRIAYVSNDSVKIVDLGTGRVVTRTKLPATFVPQLWTSGAWDAADDMVVAHGSSGPVFLVTSMSAGLAPLTSLNPSRSETAHGQPQFLPGGRRFLFRARSGEKPGGLFVFDVATGETAAFTGPAGIIRFVAPNVLLAVDRSTVSAYRFDAASLRVGPPLGAVVDGVRHGMLFAGIAVPQFSAAQTALTFTGADANLNQFKLVDRTGRSLGEVGELGRFPTLALAPDDQSLVVGKLDDEGESALWRLDLRTGTLTNLLPGGVSGWDPAFGPQGNIAFDRPAAQGRDIFILENGAVSVRGKTKPGGAFQDWSRDGKFLLYTERNTDGTMRLVASDITGNSQPITIVNGGTLIDEARFSPDGRWVAYNSNETGRHEVFVAPFNAQTPRRRVSKTGGVQPRWRTDGRELYYLDLEGRMNAVALNYRNALIETSDSHVLFATSLVPASQVEQYANTGDGQRFLINTPKDDAAQRSVSVILNWQQLLERGGVAR